MKMFTRILFLFFVKTTECFHNLGVYEPANDTEQDIKIISREDAAVEETLKIIFYVLAIIVSLVGNVCVIVVITRNKYLRTKFNTFIMNLAVGNTVIPLVCMWIHLVSSLSHQWRLGEFLCKTHNFIQGRTFSMIIYK